MVDYQRCAIVNHRTKKENKRLIRRLNIIAGQISGLKQMVESDRHCDDILIQIASVNKALKSLGNEILKGHLETCVAKELKEDKIGVIDEVIDLFKRLDP